MNVYLPDSAYANLCTYVRQLFHINMDQTKHVKIYREPNSCSMSNIIIVKCKFKFVPINSKEFPITKESLQNESETVFSRHALYIILTI